jgi:hypothetical protein
MKRMEVRCCCSPRKLLGTLPVPDLTDAGTSVEFSVMQPRVNFNHWRDESVTRAPANRHLTLQAENFQASDGDQMVAGIALKAEGVPVETLRRIPGFIEAKNDG